MQNAETTFVVLTNNKCCSMITTVVVPTPYHKNERSASGMYKPSPERISVNMVKAGIASYKELSALSGVCANTISRLNNGGSAHLATLRRLAAVLMEEA